MAAIVTTYLEMTSPNALTRKKSQIDDPRFAVRELEKPDWVFNRDLYLTVGADWKWLDKVPWTPEQWKGYTNNPNLRTFVGYYEDEIAGYYELDRSPGTAEATILTDQTQIGEVEIAYFGLLPAFIGRGVGGRLLTSAIETAWGWLPTPKRVWVHTCNNDHHNALANYQARGFKIYKVEEA